MSLHIEWRHDGRRIVLPILILRPTPATDFTGFAGQALLDTGATISGVAPRAIRHLDLEPRGKRPLGSARSQDQVQRYLIRIGVSPPRAMHEPPAFPYIFDDIVAFEVGGHFEFDLLLGMDVLSQCEFRMDRHGRCVLKAS